MPNDKPKYDAFIAYSRASDELVATKLRRSLSLFAKAWYAPRVLRIFLDQTQLAATPNLWASIEQTLHDSRYLILLASPGSASSLWVNREVSMFVEKRGAGKVLIVLTEGTLEWDSKRGRFSDRTDALPASLHDAFADEPRWFDLRFIADADDIDTRAPYFINTVADLAAALHEIPKDQLWGEEVRERRRRMRLARGAVSTLAILFLVSLTSTFVAIKEHNAATGHPSSINLLSLTLGLSLTISGIFIVIISFYVLVESLKRLQSRRHRKRDTAASSQPSRQGTPQEGQSKAARSMVAQVADEIVASAAQPFRRLFRPTVDVYIGPTSASDRAPTAALAKIVANVGRRRAFRGRLRVITDDRSDDDTRDLHNSYKLAQRARHFIFVCTKGTLKSPSANFILQEWLREHPSENVLVVIAEVGIKESDLLILSNLEVVVGGIGEVINLTNFYNATPSSSHANLRFDQGVQLLLSRILRVDQNWITSGNPERIVRAARQRSRIEEPLLPWNLSTTLDYSARARAAVQLPEIVVASNALGVGRLSLVAKLMVERDDLINTMLAPIVRIKLAKTERSAEREVSIRLGEKLGNVRSSSRLSNTTVIAGLVSLGLLASASLGGEVLPTARPWLSTIYAFFAGACTAVLAVLRRRDSEVARYRAVGRRYARSQAVLIEQLGKYLQDEIILPHLRQTLNGDFSVRGMSTREVYDNASLSMRLHDRFRLETQAFTEVVVRTETPGGASIGLAGPRGAGKTSILSSICRTRQARYPGEAGSQFGVVVPAPVEYQSEQFVVQILASICREVLTAGSYAISLGPYTHTAMSSHRRRMLSLVIAIACVTGLIVINTALATSPLLLANMAIAGILIAASVSVLLPVAALGSVRLRLLYSDHTGTGIAIPRSAGRRRREINKLALSIMNWLFYNEEESNEAGAVTPSSLGLSVTARSASKLAGKPWSTPEIVYQFRHLVGFLTASGYRVIIGIDELDKIEDDEHAMRLLNDIKALFGVEECYFLTSVSLSAVAKFEQRGLPFQDAFESAFDEVIRVEPLSARETLELLQRRLIGIPHGWAVVCHILAGGLPRDVIRLIRKLLAPNDTGTQEDPVTQLIHREVFIKARALETRSQVSGRSPDDQTRLLRTLIEMQVPKEEWTGRIVAQMQKADYSLGQQSDPARTSLYTIWALTVDQFVRTLVVPRSQITAAELEISDRLARMRLLMGHDLPGVIECLNDVRVELDLTKLPELFSDATHGGPDSDG